MTSFFSATITITIKMKTTFNDNQERKVTLNELYLHKFFINQNFPHNSPYETGWRKVREILRVNHFLFQIKVSDPFQTFQG